MTGLVTISALDKVSAREMSVGTGRVEQMFCITAGFPCFNQAFFRTGGDWCTLMREQERHLWVRVGLVKTSTGTGKIGQTFMRGLVRFCVAVDQNSQTFCRYRRD